MMDIEKGAIPSEVVEKSCKKCLHYEMCLDNFRRAKEEGLWELTDEEEYFAHADECDFCAIGYRKQSEGEWRNLAKVGVYMCTACTQLSPRPYPYCPNCGAKMKGGAE